MIRRVILGFISGFLIVAGLYQLEVLMILNFRVVDHYFELPFGYPVIWWIARDIFYTMIVLGSILLGICMYDPIWKSIEKIKRLFR